MAATEVIMASSLSQDGNVDVINESVTVGEFKAVSEVTPDKASSQDGLKLSAGSTPEKPTSLEVPGQKLQPVPTISLNIHSSDGEGKGYGMEPIQYEGAEEDCVSGESQHSTSSDITSHVDNRKHVSQTKSKEQDRFSLLMPLFSLIAGVTQVM